MVGLFLKAKIHGPGFIIIRRFVPILRWPVTIRTNKLNVSLNRRHPEAQHGTKPFIW